MLVSWWPRYSQLRSADATGTSSCGQACSRGCSLVVSMPKKFKATAIVCALSTEAKKSSSSFISLETSLLIL